MQRRAPAASLLAATWCLTALGCSAKARPTAAPPAESPTAHQAKEPVPTIAVGSKAPDFEMRDVDGKKVALADYAGKVVLLVFWATWNDSCVAQMPHVEQLAERFRDQNLVVIASCTRDDPAAFARWVRQHQQEYPHVHFACDPRGKDAHPASREFYRVTDIPEQFVIDGNGKVIAKVGGYIAGEVLTDAALAEAGLPIDAATIQQAAQDRVKRDEAVKSRAAKKS